MYSAKRKFCTVFGEARFAAFNELLLVPGWVEEDPPRTPEREGEGEVL